MAKAIGDRRLEFFGQRHHHLSLASWEALTVPTRGASSPDLLSSFGPKAFIRPRLVPDAQDLYAQTHRQVGRFLLPRVLEYSDGNQHQAARLLGIARQTLRQKLRDLGLRVTQSVEADDEKRAFRT